MIALPFHYAIKMRYVAADALLTAIRVYRRHEYS